MGATHLQGHSFSRLCDFLFFDLMKVEGRYVEGEVMRKVERYVRVGGHGENEMHDCRGWEMRGDDGCRGDEAVGVVS